MQEETHGIWLTPNFSLMPWERAWIGRRGSQALYVTPEDHSKAEVLHDTPHPVWISGTQLAEMDRVIEVKSLLYINKLPKENVSA